MDTEIQKKTIITENKKQYSSTKVQKYNKDMDILQRFIPITRPRERYFVNNKCNNFRDASNEQKKKY